MCIYIYILLNESLGKRERTFFTETRTLDKLLDMISKELEQPWGQFVALSPETGRKLFARDRIPCSFGPLFVHQNIEPALVMNAADSGREPAGKNSARQGMLQNRSQAHERLALFL